MTLPIYLPSEAQTLQVVVHSIEARLASNSSICGGTGEVIDPSDPPLYATLVRVDDIITTSGAWRLGPSGPLTALMAIVVTTVMLAGL